jgi:hypothetical protein
MLYLQKVAMDSYCHGIKKRLTSALLTKLAKAMELPTGGTLEDTRVVI